MFFNENIKKILKIFLVVFLCSEMQTSVTQNSTFEERILYYGNDINSTQATLNNVKYHASIRLKANDQHFGEGHVCSGAVIAPSVVLTTAQCVYNYNKDKPYHPSELKVVLGSISRYQRSDHSLIFSVTHTYKPKTFNAQSLKDNLAILMLERDIPEMNDNIKPIAVAPALWHDKQNNGQLKVTTWLKTNKGVTLDQLMVLNATQLNVETCRKYYGNHVFTNDMLCLTTSETLLEDSGSPLFMDNKLVGLMSFATGNLSPAVYTEVLHHVKWIHEVIGDGSHQNSSIWGTLGFLLLTFVALKRTKFMKLSN